MKKQSKFNIPINQKPYTPKIKAANSQIQDKRFEALNPASKFWGVWLPVPTVIAILNSLFWTWFLLNTVGYTTEPIEKSAEKIMEMF